MSTNPVLREGARGVFVTELQNYLNTRLSPSPNLVANGIFGHDTRRAVLRFQQQNWLVEDGIVGDATWNALRQTETYNILHAVTLVPQPTATTCWAASTAMILGRQQPVTAPSFMLTADGSLINDSELNDAAISSQYCRHFGLRMHPGQSWTPTGLAAFLERGPAMCNVIWDVRGFVSGAGSNSHWVVLAGIRGDGNANSTTIRIYNPLPQGRGNIVSLNYGKLMRLLPAATYQLFQR